MNHKWGWQEGSGGRAGWGGAGPGWGAGLEEFAVWGPLGEEPCLGISCSPRSQGGQLFSAGLQFPWELPLAGEGGGALSTDSTTHTGATSHGPALPG